MSKLIASLVKTKKWNNHRNLPRLWSEGRLGAMGGREARVVCWSSQPGEFTARAFSHRSLATPHRNLGHWEAGSCEASLSMSSAHWRLHGVRRPISSLRLRDFTAVSHGQMTIQGPSACRFPSKHRDEDPENSLTPLLMNQGFSPQEHWLYVIHIHKILGLRLLILI